MLARGCEGGRERAFLANQSIEACVRLVCHPDRCLLECITKGSQTRKSLAIKRYSEFTDRTAPASVSAEGFATSYSESSRKLGLFGLYCLVTMTPCIMLLPYTAIYHPECKKLVICMCEIFVPQVVLHLSPHGATLSYSWESRHFLLTPMGQVMPIDKLSLCKPLVQIELFSFTDAFQHDLLTRAFFWTGERSPGSCTFAFHLTKRPKDCPGKSQL